MAKRVRTLKPVKAKKFKVPERKEKIYPLGSDEREWQNMQMRANRFKKPW